MTDGLYNKRYHEIELEQRMARERRMAIVESILLAPVVLVGVAAWVVFCACM